MDSDKKKIMVTGGLGFIGTHLTGDLVQSGYEVAILDTAVPTAGQLRPGVELINIDLRDGTAVQHAMSQLASAGYETLIHLAGNADALRSVSVPVFDFAVNAQATVNVLASASKSGWKRAVIASSALVYGPSTAKCQYETDLPDPVFPYAASKLAAEFFATSLSRCSDLEVMAARLFCIYGDSRNPENSPVEPTQYAARAARGLPITVLGDPEKKVRDFVHITDAVAALQLLADKGEGGCVYNVGTGVATSLRSLLALIGDHLGRPVAWEIDMSDMSDSYRLVANIDRLSMLGFAPSVMLPDALPAMLLNGASKSKPASPISRSPKLLGRGTL